MTFRIGSRAASPTARTRLKRWIDSGTLHSSRFAPLPEPTIEVGVEATTLAVMNLLGRGK
jgi:hypothetical protein